MKFKLPRALFNKEVQKIIFREVRRQKTGVLRAKRKHLKEMAAVVRSIKNEGLPKNLVCKKLPGELGYGIFLHPEAEPILKGQIIASYAGEPLCVPQNLTDGSSYAFELLSHMVLTKEEQERFDRQRAYHPRRLYSIHVDALKKGNFTRFINHSEKPNLIADFFKIPAKQGLAAAPIEVVYLAKKTIHPGEQLLISYEGDGPSYWIGRGVKPAPIFPKTFQLNSSLQLVGSCS